MSYNGWSNRPTWNVSLWLGNEEPLYRDSQRIIRQNETQEEAAQELESYCRDLWQDGKTPDGDSLDECDFLEVVAGDWEEHHPEVQHEIAPPKPAEPLADFISKNKIGFQRSWVPSRPDGNMTDMHRHFKCRFTQGRHAFTVYFSQGSAHTEPPTASDVLDCLASDACGYDNASSFEEWAREYGYDADSRKAEKIFRTVKRQAEQLKRVLGSEAYETLLYKTERL